MFKILRFFVLKIKSNLLLFVILFFAALVRFVGIDFGLPLWLVGDEVSHIFGALKMIELKTLLPVLHANEFAGVFYYTPYLSFFYILPFILAAGFKFLFFSGTLIQFKDYLIFDPSIFFITARLISAFLGLATVYFVYAAAWQIFQKKNTALLSALFFSFSYLPVSYSHWARHWTAITFLYAIGIFILTHRKLKAPKRYSLIAVLIGIGVGINVQMTILGVLVLIWFFLFDYQPMGQLLRQKWFWWAIIKLVLLIGLAFVFWPKGYGYFLKVGTLSACAGNLSDLVHFFWFYVSNLINTEPLLLASVVLGLIMMIFVEWRHFLFFVGFYFLYLTLFYLFFGHVDRFILPLYPLLAISAGYGLTFVLDRLINKLLRVLFVGIVCVFLIIPILRFDYLLIKNDTRVQAINWAMTEIPLETKVVVLAPLMRLPATPEALAEQKNIDPQSLRNVDQAEASLAGTLISIHRFNVLNLYNIKNDVFWDNLEEYIVKNKYQYIIYAPFFAKEKKLSFLDNFSGERFKFGGSWGSTLTSGHEYIPDGFGLGLKELFLSPSLGPEIQIIKLY